VYFKAPNEAGLEIFKRLLDWNVWETPPIAEFWAKSSRCNSPKPNLE
jgi:hypothetical protein